MNPKIISEIKQIIPDYSRETDIQPENWNACSHYSDHDGTVSHVIYHNDRWVHPDRSFQSGEGWYLKKVPIQTNPLTPLYFSKLEDREGVVAFSKAVALNRYWTR
jgi:hypothetical protein